MRLTKRVLLIVIAVALAACSDHEDRERAINEGRATPAQVAAASPQSDPANAQAVHPFAATCRELAGSWNDSSQQCDVTAAACSNAGGAWQAGAGCALDMSEADCDATAGMRFEESKCILRTISPDVAEVK